jgi:hypothetical protein
MSLASRHMIDKATYWLYVAGGSPTDPHVDGYYTVPVTLPCEFETGGKIQRDKNGEEFTPASTYYVTQEIPLGAFVVTGEKTELTPPANAEKVRKVGGGTSLKGKSPEFVAWTG